MNTENSGVHTFQKQEQGFKNSSEISRPVTCVIKMMKCIKNEESRRACTSMQHDSDKKKPCVHTYIITRLSGLTKLCDCDCCISHTIHRVRECVLNIIAKIKFVLIVNVNYECKNRMCFKYYKDISLSLQCMLHLNG